MEKKPEQSSLPSPQKRIGRIYDRLLPRRIAGAPETVHKRLLIPEERRGDYPPGSEGHFVNDFVFENLNWPENPTVLDAGCGTGGTIWRLWPRVGGVWHGITLSQRQMGAALQMKAKKFPDAPILIYRQSYDETLPAQYDVIIAIESLVHSPDINYTLQNLSRHLRPGGRLVVVDDLPAENVALPEKSKARLKRHWAITELWQSGHYLNYASELGLNLRAEYNLTHLVCRRPNWQLTAGRFLLTFARTIVPDKDYKEWCNIQLTGLELQRLYSRGLLQYWCRIWQK